MVVDGAKWQGLEPNSFLHRFSYSYDTFYCGATVAQNQLNTPYMIQLYLVNSHYLGTCRLCLYCLRNLYLLPSPHHFHMINGFAHLAHHPCRLLFRSLMVGCSPWWHRQVVYIEVKILGSCSFQLT